MNLYIIVIKKLFVMFLFIFIGMMLFKKNKISEKGSESLANLLITIILPSVIIRSFLEDATKEKLFLLIVSIMFSFISLILSVVIANIFFKKDGIANFATAFSNPGFFGIPLISAILGETAVLYMAPFIACLNIFQCTYGVAILKGEKMNVKMKALVCSPFILSFLLGLCLFIMPVELPSLCVDMIDSFADLNTPIAMIVLGVYLAKMEWKILICKKELYRISIFRLIVIPIVSIIILSVLPDNLYIIKMCILIAVACPVGTNVAVYAQLNHKNYNYAAQTVVVSTLLSAISIPLVVSIAQHIWNV